MLLYHAVHADRLAKYGDGVRGCLASLLAQQAVLDPLLTLVSTVGTSALLEDAVQQSNLRCFNC